MNRIPWITLSLVGLAALASYLPGAPEALEFRRESVADGELWRPFTGQLVHWTGRMTLLDLASVLVLSGWLEARSRRLAALALTLGLALNAIGLPLLTTLATYRGMSGVASALFVALSLDLYRGGEPRLRAVAVLALVLFVGKIAWELLAGEALFAGEFPAGVTVMPAAHALGALAGLLAVVLAGHAGRGGVPPDENVVVNTGQPVAR